MLREKKMSVPPKTAASYLNICSRDDPNSASSQFNPANFQVVVPNSIRLQDVMRICSNFISVPRMFPNITQYNNTLFWYQRQVLELPVAGQPNYWLRTVANNWTVTASITIPVGIYNMTALLALINAAVPRDTITNLPLEVWTYDNVNNTVVITTTPNSLGPIAFGVFFDNAHVTPPVSYANMTYLTDGESEFFDTLGIQKAADFNSTQFLDDVAFDPSNPNSFDSTLGSNLQGITALPLFNRLLIYSQWATNVYVTPFFNPPNLSGPTTVHVGLQDLGDGATVSSQSGTTFDILTTINMDNVGLGVQVSKEVHDADADAIGFKAPRNITGFRVRLLDEQFRVLSLPRNYSVNIRAQCLYVVR